MRNFVLWGMGAILGFALAGCGGKPSESNISAMLHEGAQANLSVNGFGVPAEAVEVAGIDIELVQERQRDNGIERYLVVARVTADLKQSGQTIAEGMLNDSRQSARSADTRSIESVVMGAAFGAAAARNALRDYAVGAQFTYPLTAVITKVDGSWEVTEIESESARFTGDATGLAKVSDGAKVDTSRVNATQAQPEANTSAALALDAAMPTETPDDATDEATHASDSAEREADAKEVAFFAEQRQQEARDRAQYEEMQRAAEERARAVREAEQRELEEARKEAGALKRLQDEYAAKVAAEDAAGN